MGKTETAMRIADQFPVDLVSVDSALVYRGMDIGTAKPSAELLQAYPHALVDIADPESPYSVADFVHDAREAIARSHARKRIPLLVGGTMLYFKRLLEGLAALPQRDLEVRRRIDQEASESGWPALHARLAEIDAAAAARIAPTDSQRIQRALEVFELTGCTITLLQSRAAQVNEEWRVCRIALLTENRAILHERIGQRFDTMMELGFEREVEQLMSRPGVHRDLPSMRAVGYRQVAAWLDGECERDDAIRDAKTATRRLAKRQHTWLRGMSDLAVFDPLEADVNAPILNLCEEVLSTSGTPI